MKVLDGKVSSLIQTRYHWDKKNGRLLGEEVNFEKEPAKLTVKCLQN